MRFTTLAGGILRTILLISLAMAGCAREQQADDEPASTDSATRAAAKTPAEITLALNWFPEAEHGGFYAAEVHGDFERAGLSVKIIPGGPNAPVLQRVAGGDVMFGVSNADQILLGRAQEADVVALMAPLQTSPRCIMVHEKSGIRKFEDLQGITLAMSSTATFAAFLRKKVPLADVQIVPYPGNVAQFLLNDNYAQQAYVFSEPFVARKEGGDPHTLLVSDLGFNPYTSVLFCRSKLVDEQPELVRNVVTACVQGWQAYLESPEETNRHIHGLNPEMDLEILAYGAKALKPLCINDSTPANDLGQMTLARWQTLAEQLVDAEAIRAGAVDPAKAFTTRFLDAGE